MRTALDVVSRSLWTLLFGALALALLLSYALSSAPVKYRDPDPLARHGRGLVHRVDIPAPGVHGAARLH